MSSQSAYAPAVTGRVLARIFEHLRTGQDHALRRGMRDLFRADRARIRCGDAFRSTHDTAPLRLHAALSEALLPALDGQPEGVSIPALLAMSRVFQTSVAYYVEATQLAARHASERKASELQRAIARLSAAQESMVHEARLKAMGALADGVAHDVNNALNAVLLRTTLLGNHVSPEGAAHLASIESVVRHAAETVQRLQEFARRRDRPCRASCDPLAVAKEALELTRPYMTDTARVRPRMIDVRLAASPVSRVQADPSEVRAILVDLLLNAVEAIRGDGAIDVTVREDDRGMVSIAVADTGPGIPPEHLQRIFEPFFTTRGPRASGLGLAMAWGVLERIGGKICAANRPGGGAEFTVSLPPLAPRPDGWPETPGVGARSILLVDADRDGREALEQILLLRGHEVEVAPDVAGALAAYSSDRHEAVICDAGARGEDGVLLARAIRERNAGAAIALLSGWGAEVSEDERLVADAVFRKPIDLDALVRFLVRTAPPRAALAR